MHTFKHLTIVLDKLVCMFVNDYADIDECLEIADLCPGEGQRCVNYEGSFHCECAEGFARVSFHGDLICKGL